MAMSDVNAAAARSIGVMVDQEFVAYDPVDFIRAVCSHQEFPQQRVFTKWRDLSSRPQALSSEMSFAYCSTKLRTNIVHLFLFSPAIRRDFSLEELLFPMELDGLGFVVIVNLRSLSRYSRSEQSLFSTKVRDANQSALVWTLAHKVPVVIVAFSEDASITCSTEELRTIFELSTEIPIYHCPSGFDKQVVHEVLGILLKQFNTS